MELTLENYTAVKASTNSRARIAEVFAVSLFEYLQKELGLGGHLQEFAKKWQLKFNTNDARTLTSWMYEDSSVYLDRKYTLYKSLVVNDKRKTR